MQRRDFLSALTAAAAVPMVGQQPTTEIFNGRDLSGWSIQNGSPNAFTVENGEIALGSDATFPCWLKSDQMYENFDFSCEVQLKGWSNSGIYFGAPEHGHPMYCGYKINIFQENEGGPKPTSMGAIFPVVAPSRLTAKNNAWNAMRIRIDWPLLQVWVNGIKVQELAVDYIPELRWRLRRGYFGIENQGHPLRFRNLKMQPLATKDPSQLWYGQPSDFDKWTPLDDHGKNATWQRNGNTLRADGLGYLATKESFQDFYLQMYVRQSRRSNGGVYFRLASEKTSGDRYEIQLYDVESANYATGSLYGIERARYPRIAAEEWYLFQLVAVGERCVVRVNGDTLVNADHLKRKVSSPILLQAHEQKRWIDYKDIRITRL